jgi:putative membrane protein
MQTTILIGILFGVFSGIIPGIHPNLIATIFSKTSLNNLPILIYTTAITHTFLSTIPTIHLSTPDEDTALSLHPSQEYAQKGKAHEAILLTLVGSLISLILLAAISPIILLILKPFYTKIVKTIPFLLVFASIFLICKQKNKILAVILFISVGLFGYFTLNSTINEPLLPLFTGLFGLPAILINSSKNKIKQRITEPKLNRKNFKTIVSSLFFGSIFSFLPSMGPAQAAIAQNSVIRKTTKKDYLILVGCLNTINIIFSVLMLLELNKARNGAVAIIKGLDYLDIFQIKSLLIISLIVALPCTFACILFSRGLIKIKEKISIKLLTLSITIFLLLLILYLSSFRGVIILTISTLFGFIPYKTKLNKTILMGVLMLPTIMLYFSRMV